MLGPRTIIDDANREVIVCLFAKVVMRGIHFTIDGNSESKQSWVLGTAKIAVGAPWVVVALLASRVENAATYNTSSGALVLSLGFVLSLFAYRLVHVLGALPPEPRVFAS